MHSSHRLPVNDEEVAQLIELLGAARRILVFTGAGISTASGIPDFRGPNGIWQQRQPVDYDRFMNSEAGRIEYWDYKAETWPVMRDAKPNRVHEAVVELGRAGRLAAVLTQNVDGLHARAGLDRRKLVELHGTNTRVECQSCLELSDPEPHFESFRATGRPPVCHCGGFLKPATISFGQCLKQEDLDAATTAAREADLAISLGSSLSVYPAADFPLSAARRGVPYVIINRGPTDHDGLSVVTLRIEGDVVETCPPAVRRTLATD
jgi:NAD-dependent deacetylase